MNLRIKKLDKFIAKQFLLLFAGTFFICLFVLMMQFLWRFIDELIGKGLSMEVLAQFFEYMALMMVPQALPLAPSETSARAPSSPPSRPPAYR